MKPVDVKSNTHIDSSKKLIIKILNLKLVILLEYKNIKIFFAKGYTPNWSESLQIGYTPINDLNGKKITKNKSKAV